MEMLHLWKLLDNISLLAVIKMKIIVKAERNLQLLRAIHAIRDPIRPSLLLQFLANYFLIAHNLFTSVPA